MHLQIIRKKADLADVSSPAENQLENSIAKLDPDLMRNGSDESYKRTEAT